LGYHITPSDLTDDEKLIKELRGDFSDAWEQENLPAIDNLYADSWSSRCKDKTERMQGFEDEFLTHETIANFASISDIVINGNEAKCMIQRLAIGMVDDGSGSEWASWNRSTSHMIKEGSEWKYYGSHQDFTIDWGQGLWTRQYPDASKFLILGGAFSDCSDNRIEVDSFTVTGPPETFTDLDLTPEWDDLSPDEYFMKADIADATDGFYTHTVGDASGNIHQYTDYLEVFPILAIPNLVSPIGDVQVPSVNVTLIWDQVPEAQYYRIELQRDTGGGNWVGERNAMPDGAETQVFFDNLPAGTDYRWRVRPRQNDTYRDWDNETRSDYEYFSTP
jgi:ketosteroid isomerase-like protein